MSAGLSRALAGLLAASVALALLWGLSRAAPSLRFPPLALAELVVRLTPGDLATFFIERLQRWAIRSLAIGVTAAMAALGALLAWQGARAVRAWLPAAAGAFGLILFGASLGANVGPSPTSAAAVGAIGAAAYWAALAWMLKAGATTLGAETDLERRRALAGAAMSALGFALGGTLLGRLLAGGARGEVSISSRVRRARVPGRPRFPDIPGLSPEVTSAADHYVVDINLTKPSVDAGSWTLSVDGLVDRPLELDFDELQERFGLVEQYSALTCVSNVVGGPLVGNSKWTGVPLRRLLAEAGLRPEARDLLLSAADGYTVTIRPEVAMSPLALLAVAQNGEPLTVEHGFPCRLRVPQLYGMMNCKWLERIEAVRADEEGYWAQRGWSDVAIVRTQSRIDTVDPPPSAGAGSWIAGVAWAGDRAISRVEVSTDGERSWRRARVRRPLSPVAWSQWAYRWVPEGRGPARLAVRATDGKGEPQTTQRKRPHPAGATGYHRVEIDVA
jgi:DMSO/TMAO reductase YedYZ molybdopterin-dependent catalytic subunit